jgi:hypothetical protein
VLTQNSCTPNKKIFFLDPVKTIREELIEEFIKNEYETYRITDHAKILKLLKNTDDCFLYINIDHHNGPVDWEDYIKTIMSSGELKNIKIGVVTHLKGTEEVRKYLHEIKVPGGFVKLNNDIKESSEKMIKIFEAYNAKGNTCLRATCRYDLNACFNIKMNDQLYSGRVKDLSLAGMSFTFDSPIEFGINTYLPSVQIKLKSLIAMVSGEIIGKRTVQDARDLYVLLFEKNMDKALKDKLHKFIYQALQHNLEKALEAL